MGQDAPRGVVHLVMSNAIVIAPALVLKGVQCNAQPDAVHAVTIVVADVHHVMGHALLHVVVNAPRVVFHVKDVLVVLTAAIQVRHAQIVTIHAPRVVKPVALQVVILAQAVVTIAMVALEGVVIAALADAKLPVLHHALQITVLATV